MKALTYVTLFVMLVAPRCADARTHIHTGFASIYDRGVMGRVARVRGMDVWGCMIATPLVSRVGARVTVISGVTGERVVCRVVDVVRRRDMEAHMMTKHLVEFDNVTGLRMCRHRYAGEQPRRTCPVTIIL